MTPSLIVSYDDTDNDRDALELGRRFGLAGADVALAYVLHPLLSDGSRDTLGEPEAVALLERGAQALGADVAQHVVVHASTSAGLRELAERQGADLVVFGSDYRTAPGTVRPGSTAQRLLAGGPTAIAIAPAELAHQPEHGFERIAILSDGPDLAAEQTAESLAAASGGQVVSAREDTPDLLIIGSRPEAELGRTMLSAVTEYAIDLSRCPVLVVARGRALEFSAARTLTTTA